MDRLLRNTNVGAAGKKKKVKCSRKDMGGAGSRDTRVFWFLPVGGDK